MQHPDPASGCLRTAAEERLFRQGLEGLASIYAHQFTFVLKVTALPPAYPQGYEHRGGTNTATYAARGWCSTEAAWAALTKKSFLTLDLGELEPSETAALMRGQRDVTRTMGYSALLARCAYRVRPPPQLPSAFVDALAQKVFTNGKADHELVGRLYRDTFEVEFAKARRLVYRACQWGDAELRQIVALATTGALRFLEELDLNTNSITDAGAIELADALTVGHLPRLRLLNLVDNPIGFAGFEALTTSSCLHKIDPVGDNGIYVYPMRGGHAPRGWADGGKLITVDQNKPTEQASPKDVVATGHLVRLFILRPGTEKALRALRRCQQA